MKVLVCVALLRLGALAAAAASGNGSTDTSVAAEPGDPVLLPCYTGSVTPSSTAWTKDGLEVLRGGGSVLADGSLRIGAVAPGDEGSYLCNASLPGGDVFAARVQLQVTSGPENVSTSIGPVIAVSNGSVAAARGSTVHLNCSGSSYPSQQLSWAFGGASSSNASLASTSGPRLVYRIDDIQPSSQGLYSCLAHNPASRRTVNKSTELLVYYVPDGPVRCQMWQPPDLSRLQLNCSWSGAYPTPTLRWDHGGGGAELTEQLSVSMAPSELFSGQTLRCAAEHPLKKEQCSLTLKVSERHPDCMWAKAWDPSELRLTCSWPGVSPPPKLHWEGGPRTPTWKVSAVANNLTVTLSRAQMSEGQTVTCTAEHILLPPGERKGCSLTLRSPYPRGDPVAAAVEASSVTLTCTEATSLPPANTTWRVGKQQKEVRPGSKYVVSVEGADVKLTVLNVTKEDQDFYFCRSENPLGVAALEVYLVVKASSVNTGAIIGTFIALLIVVATFIIVKTLYSHRHQICLGGGFRQMGETGDVLNLVDSDDEQMFQDAVPQLPPLTNGHRTTLVQIHRMPSSDHEDPGTADTSPQQLDDTEEPAHLVSY